MNDGPMRWLLALLVVLAACTTKPDTDGPLDADGDGYLLSEDCDDGDDAVPRAST